MVSGEICGDRNLGGTKKRAFIKNVPVQLTTYLDQRHGLAKINILVPRIVSLVNTHTYKHIGTLAPTFAPSPHLTRT